MKLAKLVRSNISDTRAENKKHSRRKFRWKWKRCISRCSRCHGAKSWCEFFFVSLQLQNNDPKVSPYLKFKLVVWPSSRTTRQDHVLLIIYWCIPVVKLQRLLFCMWMSKNKIECKPPREEVNINLYTVLFSFFSQTTESCVPKYSRVWWNLCDVTAVVSNLTPPSKSRVHVI